MKSGHITLDSIIQTPEIVHKLHESKVDTVQDFFAKSELQLSFIMQMSGPNVRDIIRIVSQAVCPQIHTALDLLHPQAPRNNHLRTFLPTLDSLMNGGLLSCSLTEICGPPGVGKTQFCYLASLSALLPTTLGGLGDNSSVIYVDIENKFNARRFFEIAYQRFPAACASNGDNDETVIHQMLERMTVAHYNDKESFVQFLESAFSCDLLIIDSIAAIARKEFSRERLAERQMWLLHVSALLKEIADNLQIPILLTNQVMSDDSMNMTVRPALGVAWHHCVSSRLFLSQAGDGSRFLTISKSPICRQQTIQVLITDAGIIEGNDKTEISKGQIETIATLLLDYDYNN